MPTTSGNDKILGIALLILLAIPAMICIPCTLNWIFRACFRGYYKSWERKRRLAAAAKHGAQQNKSAEEKADLEQGDVPSSGGSRGGPDSEDERTVEVEPSFTMKVIAFLRDFGLQPPAEDETEFTIEAAVLNARAAAANAVRNAIQSASDELADVMPKRSRKAKGNSSASKKNGDSSAKKDMTARMKDDDGGLDEIFAPTTKKKEELAKQELAKQQAAASSSSKPKRPSVEGKRGHSSNAQKKAMAQKSGDADDDDDEFSLIFAPRKGPAGISSAQGKPGRDAPEECDIGDEGGGLDALFHGPGMRVTAADRGLPKTGGPTGYPSTSRTDKTDNDEGLSCLFGIVGVEAGSRAGGSKCSRSRGGAGSSCTGYSCEDTDDESVQSLPPCDFFRFALHVVHQGEELSLDDDGMGSLPSDDADDDTDSLSGDHAPGEMSELFHEPL